MLVIRTRQLPDGEELVWAESNERQPGLTSLDEDRAHSMADEGGAAAAAVEATPSSGWLEGAEPAARRSNMPRCFFPDTPDEAEDDDRD